MEQLGFEGMPVGCTVHADPAFRLAGLPAPVPDELPGSAAAAEGPPWAHNSLGASIHNALAGWWRLPLAQRTVTAAGALVDRGWIDEGFADETQSVRHRERAIAMVEGYVAGVDPADEPLGVERTVATRTDKIAVSGRIDRLDARPAETTGSETAGSETAGSEPAESARGTGTELVVVDYKTGRHLLTTDDARSSLALALYALAAGRALRRPCHQVELHHLPTGEVLAWSHTDQSLARHLGRAEDIAEECAAADGGCVTACPPTGTTRCSRRAPARPADGATTGGTARRAPRPRPRGAPGTAWPQTEIGEP